MTTADTVIEPQIVYPESDGEPMADTTLQFRWIVTIKENLEALYHNDLNVFVAGDLLWYPVEGQPTIRVALDALVAFGRPKGERGSYMQWRENNISPQVVFEILSPGNTVGEMTRKFEFYQRYGVEEYYLYDPDRGTFDGWTRADAELTAVDPPHGWTSPRLGIQFDLSHSELVIYRTDGQRFLTFVELQQQAEQAQQQAEQQRARAERLAAQLRALGIEPEA